MSGRWMSRILVAVALVLGSGVSASLAAVFTHNFDMTDDYYEYLDTTATVNVTVNTENWGSNNPGYTRYWMPSTRNIEGRVVYKYDLGFQIETASLFANLILFSEYGGQARGLDVSRDGVSWTTVATGYLHPPLEIIDVSDVLKGSATAYVRARLYTTGLPFGAQFLRTYYDYDGTPWPNYGGFSAPDVYQFQASDQPVGAIPEPCALAIWGSLGGLVVFAARRRQRTTQVLSGVPSTTD